MCLSAGGSPRGSTTLRLLLRETPLESFFFNLAVERTHEPCVPTYRLDVIGIWCFFWGVLDILGELDASLSRFFSLATERTRRAVSLQFSV